MFVRRLMVAILISVGMAAVWLLSDLLLLLFGAVLIAVMLRAMADGASSRLGISAGLALFGAGILVAAVLGTALYLFGSELAVQIQSLTSRLTPPLTRLFQDFHLDPSVSTMGSIFSRVLTLGSGLIGVMMSLVIVIFGGIYLAADPGTYRDGTLKLIPASARLQIAEAIDDCGAILRRWLAMQFIAMTVVGTLTTLALLWIGVPSPFALGLIAGVAEFIPYIGPIAAAVPGLIVAGTQDWQTMGWALGAYVVIQLIESNLLVPLLASRSVAIPPALAVFATVAMGILFGPLGLLLGFPLTVVLNVAIKRLYVLDLLGEPVEIAGQPAQQPNSAHGVLNSPD